LGKRVSLRTPRQYFAPEMFDEKISVDIDIYSGYKADVWSFGMLLYTLFTNKAPFDGPSYEEVKNKIKKCTEDDLKALFSPLRPAVVAVLKKFCKIVPSERLSLSKFENENCKGEPFLEILKEMDATKGITNQIWEKAMKLAETKSKYHENEKSIEFNEFYNFLQDYFKINNPEEAHYLKEALRMVNRLQNGDPKTMSYQKFEILCNIFQFTEPNDPWFIKRIVQLFKQDWFYGAVDRGQAQVSISKNSSKKEKFIVRFSNNDKLCITFKDKEKRKDGWEHAVIDDAAWTASGYKSYIEDFAKTKGLEHENIDLEKTFIHFQKS